MQPDLNKISQQTKLKDEALPAAPAPTPRARQNFTATGGRETHDPNYDETHPQSNAPTNPAPSSFSSYPAARSSIPDRLDRNSMSNQQHHQQVDSAYHQQQSQQQQQPYMNRVNEMPSGLYSSSASHRMSNQNVQNMIMDPSASEIKVNSNYRNSYGTGSQLDIGGGGGGGYSSSGGGGGHERGRDTMRRSQMGPAQRTASNPPIKPSMNHTSHDFSQAMNDRFDHYKRPPSRDSSVDRYGRNQSRTRGMTPEVGGGVNPHPHSRAQSRQRTPFMENTTTAIARGVSNAAIDAILAMETATSGAPAPLRGQTPSRLSGQESPSAAMFSGSASVSGETDGLKFRGGLGQEIPPNPYTPKRTESLFLKPVTLPKPTAAPKVNSYTMISITINA
jgi:hypothetical protein